MIIILEIKCPLIKPGKKVIHQYGINCLVKRAKKHDVCHLGCPSGYVLRGKRSFSCSEGDGKANGKWNPDPRTEWNKPNCIG